MQNVAVVRPEVSVGVARYWQRNGYVCVWCEHTMLEHVTIWKDGVRWRKACGGYDKGMACECVNPVAEVREYSPAS